jgi:predicted sugar kinase
VTALLDDFPPFPVGALRSPLRATPTRAHPTASHVLVRYPTRLNAMALDSSKIVPGEGGYPAGELLFVCALWRTVEVTIEGPGRGVRIEAGSSHPVVAEHAATVTAAALGIDSTLSIRVSGPALPAHVGLGSSSGTMAAVASAVARAAGLQVPRRAFIRFLAENHGEEIDGDPARLMPVQCLGGSAAAGLIPAAIQVVAGRGVPLLGANPDDRYRVVLAHPAELPRWDAKESLAAEARSFEGFARTGREYAREIAYRLVHQAWPALVDGDLRPLGQLLFDYRFRMGSIANCAFSHPDLTSIATAIEAVFTDGLADVLSLSSVGPLFFAVTRDPDACAVALASCGLQTSVCRLWSAGFETSVQD